MKAICENCANWDNDGHWNICLMKDGVAYTTADQECNEKTSFGKSLFNPVDSDDDWDEPSFEPIAKKKKWR